MLALESIPRPLQDEVQRAYGTAGLVELAVLPGYYQLLARVLFAFDIPLPEDAIPPF